MQYVLNVWVTGRGMVQGIMRIVQFFLQDGEVYPKASFSSPRTSCISVCKTIHIFIDRSNFVKVYNGRKSKNCSPWIWFPLST